MQPPETPRPGQPIQADWGRRLVEYVKSLRIVTGPGSGLASEVTPGGTRIWSVEDAAFWVRLTGVSGSAYAWNAVRATAGGVWEDLPAPVGTTSTDSAREENGATASFPQVVRAWREPYSKRLFFAKDTCA